MTSPRLECLEYIKRWYLGENIVSVRLDNNSQKEEICMQHMVVQTLRDLVDNPIPEAFKEGSAQLNEWVDFAFRKVMQDLDFGFNSQQEDAIKNLAFNYYIDGIRKVQAAPELRFRLFQLNRGQMEARH